MSSANNKFMLDGFAAVQAVRRGAPRRDTPANQPSAPEQATKSKKTQAGRTTLPSRTTIKCYACGYGFVFSGRLGEKVLCPKCRVFLATQDMTLQGAETDLVQTIGTVTVATGAVLESQVSIVSRRLRVAGDARQAKAECHDLEIDPGGKLELDNVEFVNLLIREKTSCTFLHVVACRNLEVRGSIDATIKAEECVTVHAGACVKGNIVTPRLVVMDGARLSARLLIGAAANENPSTP